MNGGDYLSRDGIQYCMKNTSYSGAIAVIDSGVGGLSVLNECLKIMPHENYVYLRDNAFMPYGEKALISLKTRVEYLTAKLLSTGVKAIVLACNTATVAAVQSLRQLYPTVPIIGLEPALKPSFETCESGLIAVLVTECTFSSIKFKRLCANFDERRILFLPQKTLASDIETHFRELGVLRGEVEKIFAPYEGISGVVLGCSHFSFLRVMIENILPEAKIFDGSRGCAERVKTLIAPIATNRKTSGKVTFLSTR